MLVLYNELLDMFSGSPVSRHYKDTKEENNQLKASMVLETW